MNATSENMHRPAVRALAELRRLNAGSARRWTFRCGMLTLLQGTSLMLASGAQAQTPACDALRASLSARVESTGVRGYSLEPVPARTPIPSDAKVIGTCEGGAIRMVYRRWGAGKPAIAAASASSAATVVVPAPAPRPVAIAPAPTPAAAPAPDIRAVQTPPAPPPTPAPLPVSRVEAPAPAVAPEAVAASAPMVRASESDAAPATVAAGVPPATQPMPEKDSERKAGLSARASEFVTAHWRWILAFMLLPLTAWLWAWRAHRNAYDEAGLPRGPKLN